MSAGIPNWQELHKQGRLPKNQRHNVPGLREAEALQKKTESIMSLLCDDCRAKVNAEIRDPKPEKKEKEEQKEQV